MWRVIILLFCFAALSCKRNTNTITIAPMQIKTIDNGGLPTFNKPLIISDRCIIPKKPKIKVICMTLDEYDIETENYVKMIEVFSRYRIAIKYYNSLK